MSFLNASRLSEGSTSGFMNAAKSDSEVSAAIGGKESTGGGGDWVPACAGTASAVGPAAPAVDAPPAGPAPPVAPAPPPPDARLLVDPRAAKRAAPLAPPP